MGVKEARKHSWRKNKQQKSSSPLYFFLDFTSWTDYNQMKKMIKNNNFKMEKKVGWD